jgi:hypothetical protein
MQEDVNTITLRLYWYARRSTAATYVAFIHFIDSNTGAMIGQADTPVGSYDQLTLVWEPRELYFQTVSIPKNTIKLTADPAVIEFNLYQPYNAGTRAVIKTRDRTILPQSYFVIHLPDMH